MGMGYTPLDQIAAPKKMGRGKVAAKDRVVMADLLQLGPLEAHALLVERGFLPDRTDAPCPGCGSNLPAPVARGEGRRPVQRRAKKACRKKWPVTKGTWAAHEVPLGRLAAVAWLASGMLSCHPGPRDASLMTGVSATVCTEVYSDLEAATVGQSKKGQAQLRLYGECEGDATTLRVVNLANGKNVHVRAWCGVRRGDMRPLVCYPLPPYYSGRGVSTRPESSAEVTPLIRKHLITPDSLIWHSDGAK